MSSPISPITDAMRGYVNGLLPMRVMSAGAKFGGAIEGGMNHMLQRMGLEQVPAAPDTSWHDQMVRQALHSSGARAEDEPMQQNLMKMQKPLMGK